MSIALSTARASVRQLLRDVDLSAAAVKGPVLDQAISNHYQLINARLKIPVAWRTITALTAGDADYTVTEFEYQTIGLFRLASNMHLVEKVSPAYMGRIRYGATNSNGEPLVLSINEELHTSIGPTETTFQLYPTPTETDTLEGLFSTMATVVTAGTDKLQLGQLGQRAVEYSAAAELLAAMTSDTAKRLDIDKSVAKQYAMIAENFIDKEFMRTSRLSTARFANTSYKRP